MEFLSKRVPYYMYSKNNLIKLVVFTATFALIFINIYKPFSSEHWYPVSDFVFFLSSSLIILTGVLVVVMSRIIMFYYSKNHIITYGKYALWIVAEIFFMALFYTIYTLSINSDRDIWETFEGSVINTSLVLLLPYTIMMLYLSWREKESQLQQIGMNNSIFDKSGVFSFYDEKGELRLTVVNSNLLYIESADNYVIVWYLNRDSVTKFILRNTLKNLENHFADTHILRCHRSYMVNFDQVKVMRREKEGVFLEFGMDKVPDIPISKTYSEKITQWFLHY